MYCNYLDTCSGNSEVPERCRVMRVGLNKSDVELPRFAAPGPRGCEVSVFIGKGFDIWLHCYFLTGLIRLAREGAIELRTMERDSARRCLSIQRDAYPMLVLQCKRPGDGPGHIICFDAMDRSDVWQTAALDAGDIYFKRSFHLPDTECLSPAQRRKVRPINPMFATWGGGGAGWTTRLGAFLAGSAWRQVAAGGSTGAAVRSALRDVRTFLTLSDLERYEDTPSTPKRKEVLFQTRLWDPAEETGSWVGECNAERVEMIRTLRRRLGSSCVGGLVPTPYAVKNHPDLLSNLTLTSKARRPEFIRLCRQFLVRVNIRALFDAVPYSLGETLAANNCMVSRTVRNSFATPLVAGRHYLGFTTPDECAEICRELLDSDGKTRCLREESHSYYVAAVSPANAMRMYLEQAMAEGVERRGQS